MLNLEIKFYYRSAEKEKQAHNSAQKHRGVELTLVFRKRREGGSELVLCVPHTIQFSLGKLGGKMQSGRQVHLNSLLFYNVLPLLPAFV